MKISEKWLREWINPPISRQQIADQLTMAGLEIEAVHSNADILEVNQEKEPANDVKEFLKNEDDYVFEISITPNRGDCLSTRGLSIELSAITQAALQTQHLQENKIELNDTLPIYLDAAKECPRYAGRIIKNIDNTKPAPLFIRARLFQAGIRSINLVVDVTNYVMLEMGQPMHAFSLNKIDKEIHVRYAQENEKIKLLDERDVNLTKETLIIADAKNPLAIAGVMGGLDSAVLPETTEIFLESAYFSSQSVAKTCRRYNMISESAYRFERGIDVLQTLAIERATQLIIETAGGKASKILEVSDETYLPKSKTILLRKARVKNVLGYEIADAEIEKILQRLLFKVNKTKDGWEVVVTERRSDVTIEEDLIEELARIYGYDKIPAMETIAALQIHPVSEKEVSTNVIRQTLVDLGYHDVVTYSFVDKEQLHLLSEERNLQELLNPITAEMTVMRTSLWPGLINTLIYNQNRQQSRIRIFEIGLRFLTEGDKLNQKKTIAGLISGSAFPQQWGVSKREADFYDLKGDLSKLFELTRQAEKFTFTPVDHVALHPGQSASIMLNNIPVGVMGALHPQLLNKLKLDGKVFLFELDYDALKSAKTSKYEAISKFPEIRRDLAIILSNSIPSQDISDTIREVAQELLKDLEIFDVYQGKGIDPGKKSIALSLTLQHASRTLVDEEVVNLIDRVLVALKERFNAELRG